MTPLWKVRKVARPVIMAVFLAMLAGVATGPEARTLEIGVALLGLILSDIAMTLTEEKQ